MFARDQLVRIWTPFIGPGYAGRLAGSYVPLRALLLLFPIWWAAGIFHAISSGALRATLGSLDATFPVVITAVVIVTLVLLRRVRNDIRRSLSERGFASTRRPSIATPSRFRSWLADFGVPLELAAEILSETGPSPRLESADRP